MTREEIFPDPIARQIGELVLRTPRPLEEQHGAAAPAA